MRINKNKIAAKAHAKGHFFKELGVLMTFEILMTFQQQQKRMKCVNIKRPK